MEGSMGLAPAAAWTLAGLLQSGAGRVPPERWLVIGVLAVVALYLLTAAVRCALRLAGLAVLLLGAWLAWRWLT